MRVVPIKEIKLPKGARKVGPRELKRVIDSLTVYGFHHPILVNKDLVIVKGIARYKAAKKMRMKEIPVMMIGEDTDE